MENPFDTRRIKDPQGLIDDLVGQTSRQAKAIHELNKENSDLKKEIENLKKEINKPDKQKKLIGELSDITSEELKKES